MRFNLLDSCTMENIKVKYDGNHIVAYNKLLLETFPLKLFDSAYLESNSLLVSSMSNTQHGRGNIHGFTYNKLDLVLRHYHRGGMLAKIVDDKFLWTGLTKTRAMRELLMHLEMLKLGLPVPTPVAIHIHRSGLSYRADMVTKYISNARTLSTILFETTLSSEIWNKIGETIKRFHAKNCNHADLNAHNIMLCDDGDIYLIDFDKSKIENSSSQWGDRNLRRLKRSLEKLTSSNEKFYYTEEAFSKLMQGYST